MRRKRKEEKERQEKQALKLSFLFPFSYLSFKALKLTIEYGGLAAIDYFSRSVIKNLNVGQLFWES